MKHICFIITIAAAISVVSSCTTTYSGAGGTATGVGVDARGLSYNSYDLIPIGDRITYTIDISTPEGRQKLQSISLTEAKQLAETEASRKYNCDRLIDPRFDFLKRGKRVLRITVDGRPGNYRTRDNRYDSRTRQEIDINLR
ncbi:MAG: hypothetical protein IKH05_09155 [Bacteroidaceae bacterium]|nr:hypothetical protein [Bacteroidaceae bacterium]